MMPKMKLKPLGCKMFGMANCKGILLEVPATRTATSSNFISSTIK
jgi:hypothetical protein